MSSKIKTSNTYRNDMYYFTRTAVISFYTKCLENSDNPYYSKFLEYGDNLIDYTAFVRDLYKFYCSKYKEN